MRGGSFGSSGTLSSPLRNSCCFGVVTPVSFTDGLREITLLPAFLNASSAFFAAAATALSVALNCFWYFVSFLEIYSVVRFWPFSILARLCLLSVTEEFTSYILRMIESADFSTRSRIARALSLTVVSITCYTAEISI